MEQKNTENNQQNQKPQQKKKFNWTLFWQISSIVVFAACFAYMIYQVIAFDEAVMWLAIICHIITVLVAFSFYKDTFIYSKKAFRNRILLYVIAFIVLAIPNIVGNFTLVSSGRYLKDKLFMELIDKGNSIKTTLGVTIAAEVMTFAFLTAIVLLIIEMSIKQSMKREDTNE